jgi:hypothetical protein
MPPAAITGIGGGPTLATGGPYSPECVEEESVLGTSGAKKAQSRASGLT